MKPPGKLRLARGTVTWDAEQECYAVRVEIPAPQDCPDRARYQRELAEALAGLQQVFTAAWEAAHPGEAA